MKKFWATIVTFIIALNLIPSVYALEFAYTIDDVELETTYRLTVDITNNSERSGDLLIIASYSAENELLEIFSESITIASGSSDTFSTNIRPGKGQEISHVRVFVWDSLESMVPLSAVKSIGENSPLIKPFNKETRFAVVQKNGIGYTTDDGDEVDSVQVLYNGNDYEQLYFIKGFYSASGLGVGDVFFFETNSTGYVDTVYTVYDYSAGTFTTFADSGVPIDSMTAGANGWSYNLWDEGKDIRLIEGYITDVTNTTISFAMVNNPLTEIDTTKAITPEYLNGVATFSINDDCAAYEFDAFNNDLLRLSDRLSYKDPSAIKASDFSAFKDVNNPRVFTGDDMTDSANYAVAMLVDNEIVAVYYIKR